MPFQSSSSLNDARALKNMLIRNSANQPGPVDVSQSTAGSAAGRGKLQDRLVGPHVAELLARELLDVGGIVPQPLDRARELVGAGARVAHAGLPAGAVP